MRTEARTEASTCPWWCRWHTAGHASLDHETNLADLARTPATNSPKTDGKAPYVKVGLYADYGESDPATAPSVAVAICGGGEDRAGLGDGVEVYLSAADARRMARQLYFLAGMLDGGDMLGGPRSR